MYMEKTKQQVTNAGLVTFNRYEGNPVITPDDMPFPTQQVFNPSPVMYNGKTVLLISVLPYDHQYIGQTHVATSDDGINFEIDPEPFVTIPGPESPWNRFRHVIDNRVTKIDDTYYIMTPVSVRGYDSPCMILGRTSDFMTYERIEVVTHPKNRGASLFPEKINGKYYKLDRPGGGTGSPGSIWLSSSPDLIHWGCFRPVLPECPTVWITGKIGPTPPIKTDQGWLVIFHGVYTGAGGTTYRIGAFMLDLEDPEKVLGVASHPLLEPKMDYEVSGYCDNCVFPCGAIADYENDLLKLYYGAADTRIGLATASLSGVIAACLK